MNGHSVSEDLQLPGLGETVFEQSWKGYSARAQVTKLDEDEYWVCVEISSGGQPLWSSPALEDNHHPFAFGAWFDGIGLPEWFSDVDGDGQPELLAPVLKADLSPTIFRLFRWDGNQLRHIRNASLLWDGGESLRWAPPGGLEVGMGWLDYFDKGVGHLTMFDGNQVRTAQAKIRAAVKGGFKIAVASSEGS